MVGAEGGPRGPVTALLGDSHARLRWPAPAARTVRPATSAVPPPAPASARWSRWWAADTTAAPVTRTARSAAGAWPSRSGPAGRWCCRRRWCRRPTGALVLAAGVHQTCAVTGTDTTVRCWGNQDQAIRKDGGTGRALPLTDVADLALGADFGCAASPEGTHCWGKNDFGQLARPLTLSDSALAVCCAFRPQRLRWRGHRRADPRPGRAAVRLGPQRHQAGQPRRTPTTSHTTPQCRPVRESVALAVGDTHACLLHAAGTFTCWGERYYGQLGQLGTSGTDTADVPPPDPDTPPTCAGQPRPDPGRRGQPHLRPAG